MDIILKFVLFCVQCAVSCYFFLVDLLRQIKVNILDSKISSLSDEIKKAKKKIGEFQKTPEHLGIILNEDKISLSNLAHIVVWCLALRIRYVSIYDASGFVKSNKLKFYKEMVKVKEQVLQKDSSNYKIHANFNSLKENYKNGIDLINEPKYDGEVYVGLLGGDEGRSDIIELAREVCQDVIKHEVKPSDVEGMNIGEQLQSLKGFPDPHVVVSFGKGQSLNGYLPWHIRLTEIVFLPTHRSFYFNEFLGVLDLFNRCEQRFGK